jgi:thymidylate kinase
MTTFNSKSCKRVTIFEGCDGSGKTTLAKAFAQETGAIYVHCGPFPNAENIAPFYIEAMLPALMGYQDVVLDRSWYSEEPYGTVYRNSNYRCDLVGISVLEMIAARCQSVIVYCDPGYEVIKTNYLTRNGKEEMLVNLEQLRSVHSIYHEVMDKAALNHVVYDYTQIPPVNMQSVVYQVAKECEPRRTMEHSCDIKSVGFVDAKLVLIVPDQKSGQQQDGELLYMDSLPLSQELVEDMRDNISDHVTATNILGFMCIVTDKDAMKHLSRVGVYQSLYKMMHGGDAPVKVLVTDGVDTLSLHEAGLRNWHVVKYGETPMHAAMRVIINETGISYIQQPNPVELSAGQSQLDLGGTHVN